MGDTDSIGLGVRALVNGAWGFAATQTLTTDGVVAAAREAAAIAKANRIPGAAPGIPDDPSNAAITFADARVEFDARGLVTPMGRSGVVYLTAENEKLAVVAISVAPSGNTRFWTWSPEKGWR